MTSRPSTAAPVLAVLAIVLLPLGAYFAGYFWLGEREKIAYSSAEGLTLRTYKHRWQAVMFGPAARLESLVTRRDVEATSWENVATPSDDPQ